MHHKGFMIQEKHSFYDIYVTWIDAWVIHNVISKYRKY